jgi:hypothetical protein
MRANVTLDDVLTADIGAKPTSVMRVTIGIINRDTRVLPSGQWLALPIVNGSVRASSSRR